MNAFIVAANHYFLTPQCLEQRIYSMQFSNEWPGKFHDSTKSMKNNV